MNANNNTPIDEPLSSRELAQHLRRMLEAAGSTPTHVATRIGANPRTVEAWLQGRNLDHVVHVLSAFEAIGCRIVIALPRTARQVRLR